MNRAIVRIFPISRAAKTSTVLTEILNGAFSFSERNSLTFFDKYECMALLAIKFLGCLMRNAK